MKTKPILFNSEMVRALLDGRKTQTRRIIKNSENHGCLTGDCPHWDKKECEQSLIELAKECPLGQVGDLLYVRETFKCNGWATDVATIFYKASEKNSYTEVCEQFLVDNKKALAVSGKWIPSIHMPRWASRLTLKITDVRVERVQNISEEDAIAEGLKIMNEDNLYYSSIAPENEWPFNWDLNPIEAYRHLWNSINNNWNENPYTWVINFEVIHKNVDEVISG